MADSDEGPHMSPMPMPTDAWVSAFAYRGASQVLDFFGLCVTDIRPTDYLDMVMNRWPFARRLLEDMSSDKALNSIASKIYKTNKERLLLLRFLLTERPGVRSTSQWPEVVLNTIDGDFRLATEILGSSSIPAEGDNEKSGWWAKINVFSRTRSTDKFDIRHFAANFQDDTFLMELPQLVELVPTLAPLVAETLAKARESLRSKTAEKSKTICARIRSEQEKDLKAKIGTAINARQGEGVRQAYGVFRNTIKDQLVKESDMSVVFPSYK